MYFLHVLLAAALAILATNEGWAAARYYLAPAADAQPTADPQEAQAAFDQAAAAAGAHHASTAYELAYKALRMDPDLATARKVLGFVRFRDNWYTPFAIKQLSAGKVWDDRFGWLPTDYLPRYENGERYYRGRWMPSATERKLRTDIAQGWRVESDHYAILTNESLEAGVALSKRLEMLRDVWFQVFAGFVIDDAELVRRFEGKPPRNRGVRKHDVVYFRTRDEYNAALKKQQPRIEMTLGIYFDNEHTAYFFAGDDQDPGTLWHEATHQLFSESRPTSKEVGRRNNFWVIEGVACYMESLREHADGSVTLGEPDAGRLPAARHRLLEDGFYVPLAELVAMGMQEVQSDPRIAKIYSQAAGLATFFLQAEGGKYQDAFVAYLRAVYDGRADENTLSTLTGQSYADLDEAYRRWMVQAVVEKTQ